jgi:hypothetical protein
MSTPTADELSPLERLRFVGASFYAVATSPVMPGWVEYRARVERERPLTAVFEEVTWQALADVLGARPLVPIGPPDAIIGTLVSFTDDHGAKLPSLACLGVEAERLIDRIGMYSLHALSPSSVLGLALQITDDGFRALMVCHLAVRQLARGRDARAFGRHTLSLADRCDAGRAVAPFPPWIAQGGDPLGDTYHYFANVIAGVLSSTGRSRRAPGGAAIALLFYSGPVLMHLVRERTFGARLFYGTHARVDRLGLAHGIALARRQRSLTKGTP